MSAIAPYCRAQKVTAASSEIPQDQVPSKSDENANTIDIVLHRRRHSAPVRTRIAMRTLKQLSSLKLLHVENFRTNAIL